MISAREREREFKGDLGRQSEREKRAYDGQLSQLYCSLRDSIKGRVLEKEYFPPFSGKGK